MKMKLSIHSIHKPWPFLVAALLVMVLCACAVPDGRERRVRSDSHLMDGSGGISEGTVFQVTDDTGTGDGGTGGAAPPRIEDSGPLAGRAADSGSATGQSASGGLTATPRMVAALVGLSDTLKSRVAYSVARTAWTDAVSTTAASDTGGTDTGGNAWNTGVTQSSRNGSSGQDTVVNRAINARYEGETLVFDRINLLSSSRGVLTTNNEPELPGYRAAFSPILGSPHWKGVEYLYTNSSKRWNYSIFASDVENNDDTDYLAGGFWVWLPDLDEPADPRSTYFTVAAGGNDPFQVANIASLDGQATYLGDAAGLYSSKGSTPVFRYFNADVQLTAEFDGETNTIWGSVTNARDTATNEQIFEGIGLRPAVIQTDGSAFFETPVSGVIGGKYFAGDWGGQFFGNGASSTDLPGSVAGTFGAYSWPDYQESLVGFFGAYNRELTRLPSGHGLAAGTIAVQPGESDEQGDVLVSCPEGTRACVVTVDVNSTAFYDRDGGIPTLGSIHGAHRRDNAAAKDLLDHWNETQSLSDSMDVSSVNDTAAAARRSTLGTLLEAADGAPEDGRPRLRNVRAEDMEVVGEADGITYGQWKGGPAGTLNIEFDWRLGPDLDAGIRARMERAGKSWSWRLRDDFVAGRLQAGKEIRFHDELWGTVDEAVSADDLLIFVVDKGSTGSSTGGATGPRKRAEDDYEPSFGRILLSQSARDSSGVMAHEIGHVLGISSGVFPSKSRYVDEENRTFTGPEAMRANGDAAVPFQRSKDGELAAPGTADADVDYGHLGACASLMSYCRDRSAVYRPSELDFAFLDDIGYDLLYAETASKPELYGYGAWGSYSAWGAAVQRTIQYQGGKVVVAHDTLQAGADAFGQAPTSSLDELHGKSGTDSPGSEKLLQAEVAWSGTLIGVDLGQDTLPPVFGDAELRVELSTLTGTASFDALTVHVEGQSDDFRKTQLEYDIAVTGNSFSDGDRRVRGGFFGPAHEEMAGVLDDRALDVNLLAGFGGKR